jgi:two-component system LytT family response regulator
MQKIKTIIVDDEPLARELVREYLADLADIEIVAECQNGFEALKAIQELNPGLVFLDIQMPKLDGFELLDVLESKPEIIFTTAFDQYAIKAFEQNAVDYLLKPFSKERFDQAVNKARTRLQTETTATARPLEKLQHHLDDNDRIINRLVVRAGSKIVIIPTEQIFYLEAQDDYVMIYSELGRHLKDKTLKYFEAHLPADTFVRIHRKYIANLACIHSVELYEKTTHLVKLKNGDKIRASQDGYKRLREYLR